MKYGTATTPIAPTQIQGNLAELNNGDATTTKTIDEAQHNVSPLPIAPLSAREELWSTRSFAPNENGDEYFLANTSLAFQNPSYPEKFQEKIQKQVESMISYSKSNLIDQPKISLQNVDYKDFGLTSNKEYFSVSANTLHAYKTSTALRSAGISVFGKPVPGTNTFELVAYKADGSVIRGADFNDFFDQYDDIITQEQQQAAV